MQIVNDVARRGFVIGWDPLKLGNALSCVATLFLLSRRTGLPTVFPYADRFTDLFPSLDKLSMVHVPRDVDGERLETLLDDLDKTLGTLPHLAGIAGSSFEALGTARTSGVVWFTKHEAYLSDWREDDAERHLRAFCRRGNGVVLQGSYWRQYMDMRELEKAGDALRQHLGPLRPFAPLGDHGPDCLIIGLHLRLGDYKIWMDGRFFFAIDDYVKVARAIHAELGDRPHVFHVFSDEAFDQSAFGDLPVLYSGIDLFEDFGRISRCDIVAGPPSTFSTSAAFMGKAKRVVLTRERIEGETPFLALAHAIPYPTGSYLPGDLKGAPI